MKYYVQIKDRSTNEVVEEIECYSETDAAKVLNGVSINLNHKEYKAEIISK